MPINSTSTLLRARLRVTVSVVGAVAGALLALLLPETPYWLLLCFISSALSRPGDPSGNPESTRDVSTQALTAALVAVGLIFGIALIPSSIWGWLTDHFAAQGPRGTAIPPLWARLLLVGFWLPFIFTRAYRHFRAAAAEMTLR
jgi:hypothetical protein